MELEFQRRYEDPGSCTRKTFASDSRQPESLFF